ncbi:transposase [Streptomyces sp. Tu 2975]|nr:transposase [Streptomyces sp. Tu 2975]
MTRSSTAATVVVKAVGPRASTLRSTAAATPSKRCFNQLKGFRGIATRYEKTATSYEAAVTLASLPLWARSVRRRTLVPHQAKFALFTTSRRRSSAACLFRQMM